MLKLNTLSGFGSGVSAAGGVAAVKGYFSGGPTITVNTDKCEKLTFATSVMVANSDGDLSRTPEGPFGASDSTLYGYTVAGYIEGVGAGTESDRMTYATDTAAADTDSDYTHTVSTGGTLNDGGTAYSYGVGGSSGGKTDDCIRLTHSSGTWATHTDGDLPYSVSSLCGCALSDAVNGVGSAIYGYITGGLINPKVDTSIRFTFSTSSSALHTDSDFASGDIRDNTGGYCGPLAGYQTCGSSTVSTTDKITWATGVSSTSTDMDAVDGVRYNPDGIGDNVTYGYVTGGYQPAAYKTETERMTYSTETLALHTDADLQVVGKGSGSTFSLGGV
jgi:hypothetical protein|tara:strand:+ start:242 stop:1237 length:996 start_codon:yes stop_codon:yes gene_type:complete